MTSRLAVLGCTPTTLIWLPSHPQSHTATHGHFEHQELEQQDASGRGTTPPLATRAHWLGTVHHTSSRRQGAAMQEHPADERPHLSSCSRRP
ncbi:hypothetical protein C8Q77DRAFT_1121424 [Trametes polyzona]|nr:hypothetical protein C8Q77DRAFT_1121424 [Trametes polyzona]